MTQVCIIGAGCSGVTSAKRLRDHGIDYDQFELSDDVGGNWYFRNPNGRSSVYESLHIDTSTQRLQFEDFPAPADFPDFPHHTQIHDYFRAYVDHFDLRDGITFNTGVDRAVRAVAGTCGCPQPVSSRGGGRRDGGPHVASALPHHAPLNSRCIRNSRALRPRTPSAARCSSQVRNSFPLSR